MSGIDPKFESGKRTLFRSWQFSPHGDFKFGECPSCGEIAEHVGDSPVYGSDFEREQYFSCECGTNFHFITTTAYKFGDIDQED